MIRPITLICMLLACASGLYLYQTKHRVLLLDKEIAATVQASTVARERAGVLRAEWTLLNDPERLRALADQFLSLKPVAPGQFTIMAELANRLPAPRAPDPGPAPDALPISPEPAVAADMPRAEPPAARPAPVPPVVAMTTPPPPVAKPPATPPAAERRPTPLIIPSAAPQPPAAPPPRPHPVVVAVQSQPAAPPPTYIAPPPTAREAIARNTGGGQMAPQAPVVASALGMARTMLPPPVPVSATGAASFGRGNGN
jgi:hypothetical protein